MATATINPATGETLETFDELSDAGVERVLERAWRTFLSYRETSFADRATWMHAAADILEREKEQWGELITTEMGKLRSAAIGEVEKCAWVCRFYADNAERFLADRIVETDAEASYVKYQPLGPVLAVMPWNFPFWQVFRFAAPGLMAGNVGLLKHASNVPRCARAIQEIFERAGFPEGAFQSLVIGSSRVAAVIDDDRVRAVTLTGSEGAGSSVAERAGKRLKKAVLELGGSDPFIVMPSADLERAVATAVKARTVNNGQSCIAAKRFIVHRDIADEFTQQFVRAMESLRVGDPMDADTEIGPLATPAIRDELHEQVQQTVRAGARVLTGGEPLDGNGNYYPPTVLVDVPENSQAWRDELFGPVASVFVVRDVDDALRVANATRFGLGSAAWTQDPDEQLRFIEGIEAGAVFINGMVASDPRLPFGGVKASGFGRELGEHGIHEFVNIKTVVVNPAQQSKGKTAAPE
ncbi:MAG TPA: NAD-dependent succinate-semialdehyde dehydrogenase [Longimicrobiales bacterium]|nr:NAD-dependent succinate-semialdehyde dehydrogenase [Longimicrobiales bacterium]